MNNYNDTIGYITNRIVNRTSYYTTPVSNLNSVRNGVTNSN